MAIDCAECGLIGVVSIDQELGYWIGKPYWGNGYAFEAAQALLTAYNSDVSCQMVRSSAHVNNLKSLSILRKLGFVEVGREARFSRALGCDVDHILLDLDVSRFLVTV